MLPKHGLYRVTAFQIVAPYTLQVQFDDGSAQVIDFETILAGQLYGPLRELTVFNQVRIDPEVQTLVWPNGADFDPATLHDWPRHLAGLKKMAARWAKVELEDEWVAIQQAEQFLERCGPFETLANAAKSQKIPLSTLAQAARERRLPALAVPGGWLVRASAVEKRIGLQSRPGRPKHITMKQHATNQTRRAGKISMRSRAE
jgi:hypothetical protein